jgi:glycosyltransferase involved in cell wall biosynthesis
MKRNMKILIYGPEFPYLLKDSLKPIGGVTTELYAWVYGFRKNLNRVGILTWENAHKYVKSDSDIDFVEGFNISKSNNIIGLKKKSFIKAILAIYRFKPDIIMLEGTIDILYFFSFLSRLLNIKFVYRLASDKDADERIKNKARGIKLVLYNLGLMNSQYICTQNRYQQKKLVDKFPRKKIFTLYNPVIFQDDFFPLSKKERSYIAWTGNFRKEKNLKALYEVAVACKDMNFKIAGTETPEIDDETRRFIELLKRLSNVDFIGYIKRADINNLLSHAYALLNTSYFEGFSNTFLEAWAVGTPVISTINVNPDNIIREHSLGMIAENFSEIARCVDLLLQKSDEEYNHLAQRCKKYLVENHDAQKLAKEFIENISD